MMINIKMFYSFLCLSLGKHIFSTAHKGELAEKTLPEIVEYAK